MYSGSIRPAFPIINKERANPKSENVNIAVRSPLDVLARAALSYMTSSTSPKRAKWLPL
jgi:hypothetical protein